MMKNVKILSFLLIICMLLPILCSCDWFDKGPSEFVDYAAQLKFNPNSGRVWTKANVHIFVDGDTTHFNVPTSIADNGILKARYLAINTPESTGAIEEWGKAASNFTKSKLNQESIEIILESDNNTWNLDSTGGRHLVWVWYKTPDMADYRNLNLEILQNGLAIASNSAQNSYGDLCMEAIEQAQEHKLYVYSDNNDPDFHYGGPINVTIAELVRNPEKYLNAKIVCEGIITMNDDNSFYIEEFDPDTQMYNGLTVFKGFNLDVFGKKIVAVGNRIKLVGTVTYYETGRIYQVSGLSYDIMRPDDPNNLELISEGHTGAFPLTTADTLFNSKITVVDDDGVSTEYSYTQLALNTTIEMHNLRVVDTYTTNNGGDNDGAISITCISPEGIRFTVRTGVLRDENNNLVTEDYFVGKTINVKGVVSSYDGQYQVKVLSFENITISE